MREFRGDFGVIGGGRLGLQLLHRAHHCRLRCRRLRVRGTPVTPDPAHVDVVDTWDEPGQEPWPPLLVVAVPDRAIATVAEALATSVDLLGSTVIHASGALTSDVLAACRDAGAAVASWHPLQTFPPIASATAVWDGVPCAVEGDPGAEGAAHAFARSLGMDPWSIRAADKPLYHAAASVAGNLCHAVVAAAADVMRTCGLPPADGERSGLAPLVESSVAAALSTHPWERLTGAAARGDMATVREHLRRLPPPLADAYESLLPLVRRDTASDCVD
jgi:predicted short-subunit dehydrogenase-like oxidoreductase (DUF2520 family)